mmetsp:Transcript_132837/g.384067  ORF Transcript_132837/g.384067 Transcript_132837/m.384067 type:complete len:187 (-) Transcript_132837:156-716(-)|eukprot:CAMPEP_0176094916 /NCGR_PEP_ID=MMETSP0120_2-20121206/47569_1 /TAXON_ID=160619 /ORGANISM="Kryptoperidinium foliaceum, Strain CCMP 1326" /LENGTH=186 /DNA_ID=CAMNT_0017428871 /DNA_START=35 /DNA_END=595 /DNA_ORIENTATION=-
MGKGRKKAAKPTRSVAPPSAAAAGAEQTSAKISVKKSIGKAGKVRAAGAAGAAAAAAAEQKSGGPAKPHMGPRARRAAARRAAAAARSSDKAGSSSAETARALLLGGPKPKMNGKRMMDEIEEARAWAEKMAEKVAAMPATSGRGRGRGRGSGGRGVPLSKHSRQVLAAWSAKTEFELPGKTTPGA